MQNLKIQAPGRVEGLSAEPEIQAPGRIGGLRAEPENPGYR